MRTILNAAVVSETRSYLSLHQRTLSDCSTHHTIQCTSDGTSKVIIASEDFSKIEVKYIGPLQAEFGFSSFRKIPGTDSIFLALKTKERSAPPGQQQEQHTAEEQQERGAGADAGADGKNERVAPPISLDSNAGDVTETIITVFDLKGNFYLDPPFQAVGNAKFEGLEFM